MPPQMVGSPAAWRNFTLTKLKPLRRLILENARVAKVLLDHASVHGGHTLHYGAPVADASNGPTTVPQPRSTVRTRNRQLCAGSAPSRGAETHPSPDEPTSASTPTTPARSLRRQPAPRPVQPLPQSAPWMGATMSVALCVSTRDDIFPLASGILKQGSLRRWPMRHKIPHVSAQDAIRHAS